MLIGIACARDEQHRMTPLSPWHFFMRKFKWCGIGIAVGLVPWSVCGNIMAMYAFRRFSPYLDMSFQDILHEIDFSQVVIVLGLICVSITSITLLAPRFKSPWSAAMSGTIIGLLYLSGVLFLVEQTSIRQTNATALMLFTCPGLAMVIFSWLYVRFKLDLAWFRFEN